MKIYTIGAISSDPKWKQKFQAVKDKWEAMGFTVLSPLDHGDGLTYEDYMRRSMEYVFECDGVVRLPCWTKSPGARAEMALLKALNSPPDCWKRFWTDDDNPRGESIMISLLKKFEVSA